MSLSNKPLSKEEEDVLFGDRTIEISTAFTCENNRHYFLQRENDVLHILDNNLINTLHVGFLNLDHNYYISEIDIKEFFDAMRKTITILELERYWKR
jgi:hypothetical protein